MNIKLSDHFSFQKLIKFTIPSIAMMIFSSIYGIVDGFFVSNFAGKTPFVSVNLMWPFLIIVASIGLMFGSGGTALVSKTLGENNREKANKTFSLLVYITFGLGVIFSIVGFIFIRPISINILKATGETIEYCVMYGRIMITAMPFFMLQLFFQTFFITAEKPHIGFINTILAGIINIILDAVLILLLPKSIKLAGAAIASAIGQIVGGVFPLVYFFRKNSSILRLGKTNFDFKTILKTCWNGSSEFLSNIAMNLVSILYNIQLYKYIGENGIAAYGVMMYVSMIFSSTFIGYSVGVAPIVGYHYGAKNEDELKNVRKKSFIIIILLSIMMVLLSELLAYPLAKIFVGYDNELMRLTVSGFRLFAISFLFMGIAIFGSGFFTALNSGFISAIISFLRTLVFQILAVILLPLIWGVNGIWISVAIAEVMASLFTILFLKLLRKKYHY